MSYQNARVVILGASGFIGRWLARSVPAEAETVLVVRNLDSFRTLSTAYRIKGTPVELDLTDFSELNGLFADVRPSIVFNLAGYGVDPAERDPHLSHQINAELPRKLCALIEQHHDPDWEGQHLLHAGTALEYGIAKGILSEDLTPRPTTQYGMSKLEGTNAVLQSRQKTLVLRLFNVYGPGEHEGRLFPSLIESAKAQTGLPLTAGTQKRDFTYVEDVAEGWIRCGFLSRKIDSPINLATGRLHSVREFVETAARILHIPEERLQFGKLPFRKEEMDHEGVSTGRLNELLKWVPPTSIESGIGRTIEFLESLPE